jgi:hypothetical protein
MARDLFSSMQRSHITTDHDEIRRWAEQRGGRPAAVAGTGRRGDPGILRIEFRDQDSEDKLVPIRWDEWFAKFDKERLAMILQDRTANGQVSYFNKLVSRDEFLDREDGAPQKRARASRTHRPQATERVARAKTTRAAGAHRTSGARATGGRSTPSSRASAASGTRSRPASSARTGAQSKRSARPRA